MEVEKRKWRPFRRSRSNKAAKEGGDRAPLVPSSQKSQVSTNKKNGARFALSRKNKAASPPSHKSSGLVVLAPRASESASASLNVPKSAPESPGNEKHVVVTIVPSQKDSVSTAPEASSTDQSSNPGQSSAVPEQFVWKEIEAVHKKPGMGVLASYTPEISDEVVSQDQVNKEASPVNLCIEDTEENKEVRLDPPNHLMPPEVDVGICVKTCPVADEGTVNSELTDDPPPGNWLPMMKGRPHQADDSSGSEQPEGPAEKRIQYVPNVEFLIKDNKGVDRAQRHKELTQLKKQFRQEEQKIQTEETKKVDRSEKLPSAQEGEVYLEEAEILEEGIETDIHGVAIATVSVRNTLMNSVRHCRSDVAKRNKALQTVFAAPRSGTEISKSACLVRNQSPQNARPPRPASTTPKRAVSLPYARKDSVKEIEFPVGLDHNSSNFEFQRTTSTGTIGLETTIKRVVDVKSLPWFKIETKAERETSSLCESDPNPFSGLEVSQKAALTLALQNAPKQVNKDLATLDIERSPTLSRRPSRIRLQGKPLLGMLKKNTDQRVQEVDSDIPKGTSINYSEIAKEKLNKMACKLSSDGVKPLGFMNVSLKSSKTMKSTKHIGHTASAKISSPKTSGRVWPRTLSCIIGNRETDGCQSKLKSGERSQSLFTHVNVVENAYSPEIDSVKEEMSIGDEKSASDLSVEDSEDDATYATDDLFSQMEIPEFLTSMARSVSQTMSWTTGLDVTIHPDDLSDGEGDQDSEGDLSMNTRSRSFSFENEGSLQSSGETVASDDVFDLRSRFSCL